ncbi:alpha/beta-hydrolase [Obba rivulosa]|uniref:Alpha/beta-hydrolase n=1 Tax=Obba rivulosa TaxID=1052685 RepID=A0A8E2ASZ3_9APHY|nr:alpha/beta-hydrolase [Obba rivulosa]
MQTIWFPVPVVVFLRRLINVVSTLSVSQQYLTRTPLVEEQSKHASRDSTAESWDVFRGIKWPQWLSGQRHPLRMAATEEYDMESDVEGSLDDINFPDRGPQPERETRSEPVDTIHWLLQHPTLYDPVRKPRFPVTLCHGLYGFDVRGPSAFPLLQTHYWSNVLTILRDKIGAEVFVTGVPSTGSIKERAKTLDRFLREKARGKDINFLAHSMGGLDCRHLITHIRPEAYTPRSLTTIATPHRGSPFMDWCNENIGLGKLRHKEEAAAAATASDKLKVTEPKSPGSSSRMKREDSAESRAAKTALSLASLPSSFTTLLISMLDSPAYANLTTTFLSREFNPSTPNIPSVKYFSVAGRVSDVSVWHPLWLPKMVLDGFEERERERLRENGDLRWKDSLEWGNDALVTIQSAKWGEFLGIMEECDHWDIRGSRGLEVEFPSISIPAISLGIGGGKKDAKKGAEKAKDRPGGWSVLDWDRFAQEWSDQAKEQAKLAGRGVSEEAEEERGSRSSRSAHSTKARQDAERDNDAVVKSSTDKFSAVFDWIVEQVPTSRLRPSGKDRPSVNTKPKEPLRDRDRDRLKRRDLASKKDLEKFYVALCRKLYDEGL